MVNVMPVVVMHKLSSGQTAKTMMCWLRDALLNGYEAQLIRFRQICKQKYMATE